MRRNYDKLPDITLRTRLPFSVPYATPEVGGGEVAADCWEERLLLTVPGHSRCHSPFRTEGRVKVL